MKPHLCLLSAFCLLTSLAISGCAGKISSMPETDQVVQQVEGKRQPPSGMTNRPAPELQTITYKDSVRMVLSTFLLFDKNSLALNDSGRAALNQVVENIHAYNAPSVTVIGYTDNVGAVNDLRLQSYRQAESVATYLWSQGIPMSTIQILAGGPANPVSRNTTVLGKVDNHRIEIWLH